MTAANQQQVSNSQPHSRTADSIQTKRKSIIASIPTPSHFQRIILPGHSFGSWLRKQPLRNDKTIRLYNGNRRNDQSIQHAVVDIPIGQQDLIQCADAIIYCRAYYLYQTKQAASISFTDNNGKVYKIASNARSHAFQQYLNTVFSYCNTASLARQMNPIRFSQLQPGDVLIRGGFPGHGAIIADMCENKKGEKLYLLMQGFMPAQDIHVLRNFYEPSISPWYRLDTTYTMIYTPTFWFKSSEAKRF
ncbi:MAG TPA: DUF4846 domain-containing protein [Phnomibacter sp.]|nr:DUF4846 domain-containing protein [Phnomibacter sp.]